MAETYNNCTAPFREGLFGIIDGCFALKPCTKIISTKDGNNIGFSALVKNVQINGITPVYKGIVAATRGKYCTGEVVNNNLTPVEHLGYYYAAPPFSHHLTIEESSTIFNTYAIEFPGYYKLVSDTAGRIDPVNASTSGSVTLTQPESGKTLNLSPRDFFVPVNILFK